MSKSLIKVDVYKYRNILSDSAEIYRTKSDFLDKSRWWYNDDQIKRLPSWYNNINVGVFAGRCETILSHLDIMVDMDDDTIMYLDLNDFTLINHSRTNDIETVREEIKIMEKEYADTK